MSYSSPSDNNITVLVYYEKPRYRNIYGFVFHIELHFLFPRPDWLVKRCSWWTQQWCPCSGKLSISCQGSSWWPCQLNQHPPMPDIMLEDLPCKSFGLVASVQSFALMESSRLLLLILMNQQNSFFSLPNTTQINLKACDCAFYN